MSGEFRRPKKKAATTARARNQADDEEGAEGSRTQRIEDIKELQKARERRNGLTAIECAVGKDVAAELARSGDVQMKGGGIALSADRRARLEAQQVEVSMRDQFRKETLLRDEHEEMKKYVETRLNGNDAPEEATTSTAKAPTTGPGANRIIATALQRAAAKVASSHVSKANELLSNQMLAGIPEVDLGINVRIKNILDTEQRKTTLAEVMRQKQIKELEKQAESIRLRRAQIVPLDEDADQDLVKKRFKFD